MDNIFGRLARKITKEVQKEEMGKDPLAAFRITGIHKNSEEDKPPRRDFARPEMSDIKVATKIELIRRARGSR